MPFWISMNELSLHILDVAENSVAAGANLITISVICDTALDKLTISVIDDGKGMSEDMLRSVTDPFTTTRTTRRVGLGIPLFKMAAETSGGGLNIQSTLGVGTTVIAEFKISHIDRQPLGDLPLTIISLIGSRQSMDIVLNIAAGGESYTFDTREVKESLGESDLRDVEILSYLKTMIKENLELIFGGIAI